MAGFTQERESPLMVWNVANYTDGVDLVYSTKRTKI